MYISVAVNTQRIETESVLKDNSCVEINTPALFQTVTLRTKRETENYIFQFPIYTRNDWQLSFIDHIWNDRGCLNISICNYKYDTPKVYTYIYIWFYTNFTIGIWLVDCIFKFCPVWYFFDLKSSPNKAHYLKGKTFTLEHTTKARRGVTLLPLFSFNLGAGWGWDINGTPRPFYQRQWPGARCTGGRVGPMTGLCGCRKPLTGIRSPDSPAQAYYTRINLLKPNDIYIYIYICRTAAQTSRRYILNIYSTNIHTEYFKHAA